LSGCGCIHQFEPPLDPIEADPKAGALGVRTDDILLYCVHVAAHRAISRRKSFVTSAIA